MARMDGPLIYDERPSGRIEVRLGKRIIGVVTPWPYGQRKQAHWVLALPRADGTPIVVPRGAPSVPSACRALAFAAEEWFAGAGDDFSGLVRRLRAQREDSIRTRDLEALHG
ncbi:hypothetical protein [Pseudorhodoplanes sp.]|uniref:hypothetical protein n=1 Tax=Pseudorhodoplanes sp. TaxID=1934341 RepID=UPI003D0F3F68